MSGAAHSCEGVGNLRPLEVNSTPPPPLPPPTLNPSVQSYSIMSGEKECKHISYMDRQTSVVLLFGVCVLKTSVWTNGSLHIIILITVAEEKSGSLGLCRFFLFFIFSTVMLFLHCVLEAMIGFALVDFSFFICRRMVCILLEMAIKAMVRSYSNPSAVIRA